MNKDIIKRIIIENQEFLKTVKIQKRKYTFEENVNYVVVGARRAGKTYFLLYQLQLLFEKSGNFENVLYINFEDERLIELQCNKLDLLIQCYMELYQTKPIIFFDEIQNITGWEKFARRLADTGYRIYITGSNAKMLSKEIATTLGGRFFIKEINPLSFVEYLDFHKISINRNIEFSLQNIEIKNIFNKYMNFGGFPETIQFQNSKEYLSNLYQKVFYGDVLARHNIKNDFAMRLMVKKIAESVTNETSFNRLKNIIVSIGLQVGTATLIEYYSYLKDSFLLDSIGNYSGKFTERESKRKFYFIDNGILQLFLTDQPQQLLENMVFNHLKHLYGKEIYYIQKDFETDFYIPEQSIAIQVCMDMNAYEIQKREVNSLKKSLTLLNLKRGLILTKDEKRIINEDGFEIEVLPVWLWMLNS